MKKLVIATFISCIVAATLQAQEMNFEVNVLTPHLQKVDKKVFEGLKNAIKEFINAQKWTDDVYDINERITGNITLTIKDELSLTSFSAELAITANRPVYGSDVLTPILIHRDADFTFNYELYQPLLYSKNSYSDNLTSVLGYYVYTILALDYDSFSSQGGEPYWVIAQDIYNAIPDGAKSEWRGNGINLNRYWFIENMLGPRMKNYREAMYQYHRLGLDLAHNNVDGCRAAILESLTKLEAANSAYPNSLVVRMFSNTKGQEMTDIFKGASTQEKTKFIQIMTKIDPANGTRYAQVGL